VNNEYNNWLGSTPQRTRVSKDGRRWQ